MKRNAIATTLAAAALMLGQQAVADQVILDDLIVDGSTCVGQDCVNGESFGFDTIRLKENNLRIRAVDTSSTSSFPSRDWQLTFNDSANGGQNKFSIDDIDAGRTPFTIEGNAPSHSLYADDSGNVGFGTSTPVVNLHSVDGNTPTLRLEQNGSSGFTPQTWDMASNEANFFIRDATNGSTLPFRIQPGAPSSALSIMSDGKIGLGTWSPTADLDIRTSNGTSTTLNMQYGDGGGAYGELTFNEAGSNRWSLGSVGGSDYFYIYNYSASRYDFAIQNADGYIGLGGMIAPSHPVHHQNGAYLSTGGAWTNASSRNLKHDIQELPITVAMATLNELKPVTFRYNTAPKDQTVGFIAEDVPELVATPDHKGLSTMDIVAVLTSVVKQQQSAIEKLEKMVMDDRKQR